MRKSNKNIYISWQHSDKRNAALFEQRGFKIVGNIEDASAVLFTDGADICPSIYGQKLGKRTYTEPARTVREMMDATQAISLGLPLLGIGRGLHLIHCLANTQHRLLQHVDNHNQDHEMITYKGQVLQVNGQHHQIIDVSSMVDGEYTLLGYTRDWITEAFDQDNRQVYAGVPTIEPEAVYYPNISGFGVQYNPELLEQKDPARRLFMNNATLLIKTGEIA